MKKADVMIIGAGLAAWCAASILEKSGWDVLIVEKNAQVGGRMATKTLKLGVADGGAQFFTARSYHMKQLCKQWEKDNIIKLWTHGFPKVNDVTDLSSWRTKQDGHPRYCAIDGMAGLLHRLWQGKRVKVNHQVDTIETAGNEWKVKLCNQKHQQKKEISARMVLCTSPVPESLQMIERGHVKLGDEVKEQLKQIQYFPSLGLLTELEGKSALPSPGGVQIEKGPIHFIADNKQKGISTVPTLTIHASGEWSQKHFDKKEGWLKERIYDWIKPFVSSRVCHDQIIRWKYATPHTFFKEESLVLSFGNKWLGFAGDAFGQAKVEGAILSGRDAALRFLRAKR